MNEIEKQIVNCATMVHEFRSAMVNTGSRWIKPSAIECMGFALTELAEAWEAHLNESKRGAFVRNDENRQHEDWKKELSDALIMILTIYSPAQLEHYLDTFSGPYFTPFSGTGLINCHEQPRPIGERILYIVYRISTVVTVNPVDVERPTPSMLDAMFRIVRLLDDKPEKHLARSLNKIARKHGVWNWIQPMVDILRQWETDGIETDLIPNLFLLYYYLGIIDLYSSGSVAVLHL